MPTLNCTFSPSGRALNHSALVALVAALALESGGGGGDERLKSGAMSGGSGDLGIARRRAPGCVLGVAPQVEIESKTSERIVMF